jgi:hypothetical protein
VDETRARELQSLYVNGDSEALGLLYIEMKRMAKRWATYILRSKHVPWDKARLESIGHDAATGLMLLYLNNPDYRIFSFYERVRLQVLKVLFHKSERKYDDTEDIDTVRIPGVVKEERRKNDAMESVLDGHAQGKQIVLDIASTRWYKDAIVKISAYVKRPWIYQHSIELHTLYRMTRCPKTKKRSS